MKYSIILVTSLLFFTAVHAVSSTTKSRKNLRKNNSQADNPNIDDQYHHKSLVLRDQKENNGTRQQHSLMKMTLHTDRYPSETSWKIVNNCNGDSVVMSGGTYKNPFSIYEESATLPPSQYTVEIKDAYGDGICCGQGNGSFQVIVNDEVVASGGQFGRSESQTWGSCHVGVDTAAPTASPTAAPTTCEMSYEIILKAGLSSSDEASWNFAYGQNRSKIAANSSGTIYTPGSSTFKGCLRKNCYRFQIKGGIKMYSLFINGYEVASDMDKVSGTETILFGTCEQM